MAAELSPEDIVDLQRLFETGRAGALSRTMFNTITDTALALKAAKAELARVIEERDSEKSRANSIDAELVSVLRGKMALEDRFGNGHETLTATLERLTAELARVTAERDEARERAKTLYTAASCVASAIAVKHAHYEDAHREPKPRRAISVDEANWRRLLDAGCEGDTAYLDDHLAAKAEIATARADALARRVDDWMAVARVVRSWIVGLMRVDDVRMAVGVLDAALAPSPAPEPNRFRCPACPAAPVTVDEDGCCATCGADAELYFDADAADPAPSGGEAKASDRDLLGRLVREVWVAWAREQPSPKASWLVPWEGLGEPDREVDRRIGERLAAVGAVRAARAALAPSAKEPTCPICGRGAVGETDDAGAPSLTCDPCARPAAECICAPLAKEITGAPARAPCVVCRGTGLAEHICDDSTCGQEKEPCGHCFTLAKEPTDGE